VSEKKLEYATRARRVCVLCATPEAGSSR